MCEAYRFGASDSIMVRGLKLISLRRFEVTTRPLRNGRTKKSHLRDATSCYRISTIHYHTTKQLPPIFWKFAKVRVVMDNTHLTTTHPPSVSSPEVAENFSWYDEVVRAEEAGELAIADTSEHSEIRTPVVCHEPLVSQNNRRFTAATQVTTPKSSPTTRKSRQGSGSRQRQREKFQMKQEQRRLSNQRFENSIQENIKLKYGLPSTPKPNLTQAELLTNVVHIQEERDAKMSQPADRRGLSRKSLDAYLKILKSSHKSVLSEPLDMSSFTRNLIDSEDVSAFFTPKSSKAWILQAHPK